MTNFQTIQELFGDVDVSSMSAEELTKQIEELTNKLIENTVNQLKESHPDQVEEFLEIVKNNTP